MKKNKRRKPSFWDRLIICLFIILLVLVGSIAYAMIKDNVSNSTHSTEVSSKPAEDTDLETEKEEEFSSDPGENKINVALFGIDPLSIHTDVNMIASFDKKTKAISLISVPRDTKVKMNDRILKLLEDNKKFIPEKNGYGVCKLTEVYAYTDGLKNIDKNALQTEMLEDLMEIEIDHYVTVNTKGFKSIVDAVGGVDFDVKDRLYYNIIDENIIIDLYPGMQHLDGEKAEQLVRFRDGYAAMDLKRIEVQRDFLKALLEKVTSTETIIKSAPALIKTMFDYVTTDVSVFDALKYVEYLDDISMDNFYSETIPGEGGSFFTVDEKALEEMVQRVFFSENPGGEPEEELVIDASGKFEGNIEVSNGGTINGLAGKKAEMLKNNGYNVTEITTFSGTQQNKTRIIVADENYGKDLLEHFPNANIEVNSKHLTVGTDMKIILGLDEK